MEFSGKHQAFLAAMYNVRLKEQFGEQGRRAFIHAAQCYAEQRGHRMAQRAIRDGKELTVETYEQYRELLAGHEITIKEMSPDFVMHVTKCEWAETYEELGLSEEGREYCLHLDTALCRGFNPYIPYHISRDVEGCWCEHRIVGANFNKQTSIEPTPGCSQSIEYHCGNLYWSFNQTMIAIFGADGLRLGTRVLQDFEDRFGKDMADRIMLYRNLNYDVCNGGRV